MKGGRRRVEITIRKLQLNVQSCNYVSRVAIKHGNLQLAIVNELGSVIKGRNRYFFNEKVKIGGDFD